MFCLLSYAWCNLLTGRTTCFSTFLSFYEQYLTGNVQPLHADNNLIEQFWLDQKKERKQELSPRLRNPNPSTGPDLTLVLTESDACISSSRLFWATPLAALRVRWRWAFGDRHMRGTSGCAGVVWSYWEDFTSRPRCVAGSGTLGPAPS